MANLLNIAAIQLIFYTRRTETTISSSSYGGADAGDITDFKNRCETGSNKPQLIHMHILTLKVLVTTIDAQWEGMGDAGSARYKPALLPPYPTIRVLSYSNL